MAGHELYPKGGLSPPADTSSGGAWRACLEPVPTNHPGAQAKRLVMRQSDRLRPGDLVEVKTPDDILKTLDGEGSLDCLPFMPEMIECCGRRFRVSNRAVKVCFTGKNSSPRRFREDDVVLLDEL